MIEWIQYITKKYLSKYKKTKKLYKCIFVLSMISILITTYILIRPGMTLEENERIYWVKINDTSEITTSDIYMIVNSADTYSLTFNNTSITKASISVSAKGTTQDSRTYYDITGDGITDNCKWQFGTNITGGSIKNYGDQTKYFKLTNYSSTTDVLVTQANATTNTKIEIQSNNLWHIYRSSENGNNKDYFITYTSDAFSIQNANDSNADLNIYKQIIVTEDPDTPDDPVTPIEPVEGTYWVKLESTSELTTEDVYMFVDSSNNTSITYSDTSTAFVSGIVNVESKGTTQDGKTYYNITGDGSSENSQWKITTNTTVDSIYNNSNNDIFMRISTYNSETNIVNQTTTTLSSNSANNISISSAGNGLWYLTRTSSQTGTGTYYVNYSNNTYGVATNNTNAALNIYKKVTVTEIPDEPDKPVTITEKWILVNNTNDIKAGDTYIIGYYNDSQYTGYTSHYMGVNDSNNIVRGEITFEEIENDGTYTYYKTNDATDNFRWILGSDTTGGTIKNVKNNLYINFGQGTLSLNNTGTITTMEWNASNNYWLIHNNINDQVYYLKFNNANNTYQFNIATGESYRAMKIYKLIVEYEEEDDDPTLPPIEEQISGNDADSGKILTDKTVSYNNDIFNISLSAIGQDYNLTNELNLNTNLLDVVFVLDASQYPLQINYSGGTRNLTTNNHATNYVNAINQTITRINELNPDNRVGIVLFNSTATTILPLNTYAASDNTYISVNRTSTTAATYSIGTNVRHNGTRYTANSVSAASGRYTQLGIKTGANLLADANNATTKDYTFTYNYRDGSTSQVTKTVQRTPILILLTDGVPTYGTATTNDPTTNNRAGGTTEASLTGTQTTDNTNRNNQSNYALYTVRTAKYFKNQIETHYYGSVGSTYNTRFYTILTPSTTNNDNANLSNLYKAMLVPNQTNVNALSTTTNTYGRNFRTNMRNDTNYTNNNNYYIYNTDSYNSTSWTANGLATTMTGYLPTSGPQEFGLKLKDNLTITDYIGEGMEIKTEPKLIYNNITHNPTSHTTSGNTTTYHYTGTYTNAMVPGLSIDLSTITAQVITDTDNLQTVKLIVPESALPLYHTSLKISEQPVKLTFDVGLNEESLTEIENQTHGELIYYSNRWDDVTANAAYVTTNTNPYFSSVTSTQTRPKMVEKGNLLTTGDYSWELPINNLNIQYLRNNGKLRYYVDTIDLNINTIWNDISADENTRVKVYVMENNILSPLLDKSGNQYTLTLVEENEWNDILYYLPTPKDNQIYYLVEDNIDGYITSYNNQDHITIDSKSIKASRITYDDSKIAYITITNTIGAVLPNTGGDGTTNIYIISTILVVQAIIVILFTNKKYIFKQ